MESAFVTEILKAIGEGNTTKGAFLILVFIVVWLQLRSLKKEFKTLNCTVSKSFAAGEVRFTTIEKDVHSIKEDMEEFKNKIPKGGLNERPIEV